MTIPFDVERYQRALERWRVLAERRLEHMTVLYESGRWRRYFSEEEFIGVIRETRMAVDTWRRIVPEHETIAALFATPDAPLAVRSRPQPAQCAAPSPAAIAAPSPASFAPPLSAPLAAPPPSQIAIQPPAPLEMPVPEPPVALLPSPFTTPLPELHLSLG
jgi:uncharacterized repeat protein (TIGR03809 family)